MNYEEFDVILMRFISLYVIMEVMSYYCFYLHVILGIYCQTNTTLLFRLSYYDSVVTAYSSGTALSYNYYYVLLYYVRYYYYYYLRFPQGKISKGYVLFRGSWVRLYTFFRCHRTSYCRAQSTWQSVPAYMG